LLKGLEISEVNSSDLERTKRLDSEFYESGNLHTQKRLEQLDAIPLTQVAGLSDGNHMGITQYFTEEAGVPYYRGQDVGYFSIEQSDPQMIAKTAFELPSMARSHLQKGDVLVSIVGTVGGVSMVKTDAKATCSCKIAILRPYKINAEYFAVFLRSSYGQGQIQKFKRGAVQQGLLLEDFDQITVPLFSSDFQKQIKRVVEQSFQVSENSISTYAQAENLLLEHLGLTDFTPTAKAVNVKSFKESFISTGRLDAEFYDSKYDELEAKLHKIGNVKKLCELVPFISRGRQPEYSEAGSLRVVNSKHVRENQVILNEDNRYAIAEEDALLIRPGDVLMNGTGVGTIGRCAPYLHQEYALPDNHVTILRPHTLDPVYLAVYLSSFIGQLQVEKFFKGSSGQIELYPSDIQEFLIWEAPQNVQQEIRHKIEQAHHDQQTSNELLELAKRAVEVAIENNEATATAFIKQELERLGVSIS
jgi:restriction endonuclease S subunit